MRFAGLRVNLMWLGAVIAVCLVAIFMLVGRDTPSATAQSYLEALGTGDYARLTDLTYLRGGDKQTMENEYKFATQQAGKNYSFLWRIKDEREADANTAAVQISVVRNARRMTSYDEDFEIPLVKQNGKWLVDVAGINDLMYPALPR